MNPAILGTKDGIYLLSNNAMSPLGLTGHDISAVSASRNQEGRTVFLAGSYGDGLFRSENEGTSWTSVRDGLTAPAFRAFIPDPFDPDAILCGTEPGQIFRSQDFGLTWQELAGIQALEGSDEWFLPYSPRAGAVRNIYSPPGSERLLASVEVGGLLVSPDQGATWTCRLVAGDSDIHFITGHPNDPSLLYAALGWASLKSIKREPDAPHLGGIARSRDGGRSWEKLYTHYTRAVIVPPTRPDLLLAAPAEKVGGPGRIEVSADGGDSWQPAGEGIESPMRDMVEVFTPAPDGSIWAMCSGGRLFRADPGEWQWESVLPDGASTNVRSVAFVPEP